MRNQFNNRSGFVSVDFLFGMTVTTVVILMMFALSTTLSMIEVAQYVAFATARAHAAGADTQDTQTALGNAKYKSFQDPKLHPVIANLLKNGWFEVDAKVDIRGGGETKSVFDMYASDDRMPREGVRFRLTANILKMNLPFVGNLVSPDGDGFGTYITGFLIREPSGEECRKQLSPNVRGTRILDLDPRFNNIYSNSGTSYNAGYTFAMEDNGC